MGFVNEDVPVFEALLRDEYLYDLERGHGAFTRVAVFGVAAVPGRALGFHVMTERGAQIGRVPIHSLCTKPCRPLDLELVELWDVMSPEVSVHEYGYLRGRLCQTILPDRSRHPARYLFTVDWIGSSYAEGAGDLGWKCAHVLELDSGPLAAQPNNRILWYDPAFIEAPHADGDPPEYRLHTRTYSAEGRSRWRTEGEGMFYTVRSGAGPEPEKAGS